MGAHSFAGKLDYRVAFDAPTSTDNGGGGMVLGWQERLICWAGFRFLRGGETVQAARLQGRQPVVVTIRASAASAAIDTDWRMRDARSGTVYAIRTKVPSEDRAFYELTCESGAVP
jgi:SPP1 family predicted phage head-tail adaptor